LANRSIDTFLMVVSGGELAFDDSAGDFDWTRTTALSPSLKGNFPVEPFYRIRRIVRPRSRTPSRRSSALRLRRKTESRVSFQDRSLSPAGVDKLRRRLSVALPGRQSGTAPFPTRCHDPLGALGAESYRLACGNSERDPGWFRPRRGRDFVRRDS